MSLFPTKEDKVYERGFRAAENHWKERAEAAEARVKELEAKVTMAVNMIDLILPLAKSYKPEGQTEQAKATCRNWIAAAEDFASRTTKGGEG